MPETIRKLSTSKRGRAEIPFLFSLFYLVIVGMLSLGSGCGSSSGAVDDPSVLIEAGEELSGGDTTVFENSPRAFSLSARNLTAEEETKFLVGDSFFDQNWVIAPSSTTTRDGLGPVFNARSCSGCHSQDGRGAPPQNPGDPFLSLLFRLSVPGADEHGGPLPEPNYGLQLNTQSILGVPAEGEPQVVYAEVPGNFEDGSPYSLRNPTYSFVNLNFGSLPSDMLFSPRVAPQMVGMGLLEAIPEATILSQADPNDANGDGISGRPNYVWDAINQKMSLGRFGWKANQASIPQQVAGAFKGDIGITSSLFSDENCTDAQTDCKNAINGGQPEISDSIFADVSFYARTLAVPARRDFADPTVLKGKKLFQEARCTQCHTPKYITGDFPDIPELSGQTIRPYTDLLLHDMGDGLADGRPDFSADGREWRTPPLWGIGLFPTVNEHSNYLHDGRARNLTEAILWHGGEGEASKEAFRKMAKEDREALVRFLESF